MAAHGIADLRSLLLDAIEQCSGPAELARKKSQAKGDGEPSGTRENEHHQTREQEKKTADDFHDSFHWIFSRSAFCA